MSNVIEFPIKPLHCVYDVIRYMLNCGQHITIGTSNPEARLKELKERFPNAHIEITSYGVKVSCQK